MVGLFSSLSGPDWAIATLGVLVCVCISIWIVRGMRDARRRERDLDG